MAKDKMPVAPKSWERERHEEIEGYGLGIGFANFVQPGNSLRGILRTFFKTKFGMAVSVQLVEAPSTGVFMTDDAGMRQEIVPVAGDMVNLSLSPIDLQRKLHDDLVDRDVGIQYTHDVTTKSGAMKVYRVVVFGTEVNRLSG
ncbi:hypothetical protein LCGC14_0911980 [marine sediment metagenome]|uniref:Uncharacterized protein n=1 Tax=marine sediment metagenome TaxID=412755 RepID=A0A0F9PE28_9ZZZZ